MGSIPGPVIVFRIDQPGLSAAVAPAMQQLRSQAQATTNAIADDWKRLSAQIRASLSTGVSTQREMTAEQSKLVGILDQQIGVLRQRNDLTNRELSTLKAMTLERERQADAIKRGVGIGVTSGTSSALGQVSTQTTLGIERILDSIVNRYLGGAAGALTRTVRDVSYYSAQAGGNTGGGILASMGSGLSGLVTSIGPEVIAIGSLTAALAALGIAAASSAKSLIDQNETIKNTASVTGLSTREVQSYGEAAKLLGLDSGTLTNSLARLQVQLGEYVRKGEDASGETGKFVKVATQLGVSITDATGHLRPAGQIIGDFGDALKGIQNPADRTALAMDALGVRGRELAPLLVRTDINFRQLLQTIDESGVVIDPGMTRKLDAGEESLRKLGLGFDAAKVKVKEFLAEQFFDTSHKIQIDLELVFDPAKWLRDVKKDFADTQINVAKELSRLTPTGASAAAFSEAAQKDSDKNFESVLKTQQEIEAGGKRQLEIENLRKEYNLAIKDHQTEQAAEILVQINSLKSALDLEKQRLEVYKKIASESASKHPGQTEQQKFDELARKTLGPSIGIFPPGAPLPPGLNLPGISGGPAIPGASGPDGILDQLKKVNDEYLKETQSETDKIKAEFDSQLDYWKFIQSKYPDYAKQASDAIVKLQEEETKKLSDIQDKAFEKYKKDSDKLFEDLLSGNTKGFTKTLQKDVLDIVTQPARKMFDDMIGHMLQGLDGAINGKAGSGAGSGASGSSSGSGGGLLGPILARIGIGGTAGYFPGSTGLGKAGSGSGTVAIQSGQTGVQTQTMNVQANVVNIGGGSGSSSGSPIGASFTGGTGGILPQFGSFFGNNNPFGGGTSFFGNNNPLGSATSKISGFLGGNGGSLLGGLALAGMGVAGGGIGSTIAGATTVAQSLAKISGGGSNVTGALGGLGTMASGIAQGGVGGTLESTAGGAAMGSAIGTMILPGFGTVAGAVVGAAAGLISGVISSIVGGPSWTTRVAHAMKNQAVYLPPSETFDFSSNGSIANTLQTGFSQSGSTISNFRLPANTPFWANKINGPLSKLQQQQLASEQSGLIPGQPFLGMPSVNPFVGQGPLGNETSSSPSSVQVHFSLPGLMDQNMAKSVFTQHAQMIAQLVGRQLGSVSSGYGRSVRSAVALA